MIDKWVDQGSTEWSGSTYLSAGKHAIEVQYFENGGGQNCTLSWAGPGVGQQTIPSSALSLPAQGFIAEYKNDNIPYSPGLHPHLE